MVNLGIKDLFSGFKRFLAGAAQFLRNRRPANYSSDSDKGGVRGIIETSTGDGG